MHTCNTVSKHVFIIVSFQILLEQVYLYCTTNCF